MSVTAIACNPVECLINLAILTNLNILKICRIFSMDADVSDALK